MGVKHIIRKTSNVSSVIHWSGNEILATNCKSSIFMRRLHQIAGNWEKIRYLKGMESFKDFDTPLVIKSPLLKIMPFSFLSQWLKESYCHHTNISKVCNNPTIFSFLCFQFSLIFPFLTFPCSNATSLTTIYEKITIFRHWQAITTITAAISSTRLISRGSLIVDHTLITLVKSLAETNRDLDYLLHPAIKLAWCV